MMGTRMLPAALAISLALGGCDGSEEKQKDADPDVPINVTATDLPWTDAMSDDAAYDSVTGSIHSLGCLDSAATGWALDSGRFTQETSFELIEDKMSLYDKLNVSYSTSLNARFYKSSAEYKMTNELHLDTHSVWALLRISVVGPTLKRTSVKMAPAYYGQGSLPDLATFRNACGDQFLYRIHTGASYYALLRITVRSLQEKNDLSAKLKSQASVGGVGFKSSTDFENHFSLSHGSTQISSYVYKTGALTTTVIDDLADVVADGETWLAKVVGDFQCTRTGSGDIWSSTYGCTDWSTLKDTLKGQYAAVGSFVPYDLAADWGKTAATKPDVVDGLAWMGNLGAEYARNAMVLDALQSILSAPDLYLSSSNPLKVFGRADLGGGYPMLNPPAQLPYQYDTPDKLQAVAAMADQVAASIEGLRWIARLCTQDGSGGHLPATIDQYCSTACASPDLAGRYGGTAQACVDQCRATRMCDIAYEAYGADPQLNILEIEPNLMGKPMEMPSAFSYRHPGDPFTTFNLPAQRQRTPIGCADYLHEAAGQPLTDGEYLVYFGGAPDRPFYVYCDGMSGTTPTEYLSLVHTTPDADLGLEPGLPAEPALDSLANFGSDILHGPSYNARHYRKLRVYQAEGVVFLEPDTKHSVVHGATDTFFRARSVSYRYAYFDIDLRGLPLELSHRQQFLTGHNPWATTFDWGVTRLLLDTDPAPHHANRVLQKLRVTVNGNGGGRLAWVIDHTELEDDAVQNDGFHVLNLPPGSVRLTYVDAPNQRLAAEHSLTWVRGHHDQPANTTGDRIVSFRKESF